MNKEELLALFVKAAEKQEKALDSEFGGWGHSIFCNYSQGDGTSCNCGIKDMIHALRMYRENKERS